MTIAEERALPQATSDIPSPPSRFLRWLRQGHVLLGLSLWTKLVWFDEQMDEPFFRIPLWVATTLTTVLLTCWLPWISVRTRFAAALTLDVMVTALIIADLLYFRFFSSLMSFGLMSQARQVDDVSAAILSLVRWSDIWLLLDIVLAVILLNRVGAERLMAPAGPFRGRRTRELTIFALALSAAWIITTSASQSREGSFLDLAPHQATGLLGYHVYDAARFVTAELNSDPITAAELNRVRNRLEREPSAPSLAQAPKVGEFRGSNVLVIQVEALQGLMLGREVGGDAVTPNLNALLADSVYFNDAYHQTAAGHTADAEWAAGCSMLPARDGTAFFKYSSNNLRCLPEILGDNGYTTAVHHANSPSFWNRSIMYPAMGYEEFYSADDFSGRERGWGVEDSSFFDQTVDRLAARGAPFYDVAITLSSHYPFDDESMSGRLDAGSLDQTILGNYLNNIHYADESLGGAIRRLKESGLWSDTIVVIYGDHDSGITDRSLFATLLGSDPTDYEFAQARQHVPLIVHLPMDIAAGTTVDQPVGQVDIPPMLGRLLDVAPSETRTFLGTDPFRERSRPVVLRNGGFVTHDYLLASYYGPCFDRSSGKDVGLDACAEPRGLASEDLEVSDLINDHDLAGDFGD